MAQETQQNGCVERFAQQVDTMGVKSCEPVSEQVLPRISLDDLLPTLGTVGRSDTAPLAV